MTINDGHLQLIIENGNFDSLIGEVESAEFECKAQQYLTDTDSHKRELAKDVSAFANASGGFIFIGVKTKPSVVHFGDEVEAIRPFPQTLVNTSQYLDILRAWVFPDIPGIDVSWVATNSDPALGIAIIKIPRQDAAIKPFLITKTLDGPKQVETVFGYVQRKGDKNPPLEVKELQGLLRSGIHYQEKIDEQLSSIMNLIKENIEHTTNTRVKENRSEKILGSSTEKTEKQIQLQLVERISKTIQYGNLKAGRLFIISAQASEQSELKTIFVSTEGSIKHALEHPPILRRSGWSMETLDQAKIQKGEFIRVTNGMRKVIDLYRDGTMIFAAKADSNFLTWGKDGSLKINPLALVEVVYSFVNLYLRVIADFSRVPEQIAMRTDLRNMHLDGEKNFLVPYSLTSSAQQLGDDAEVAPDNNWYKSQTFTTANFNVATISYDLVREIYLWFGHEDSKIPYVKDEDGFKMIDADAIAKMG